MPTKKPLTEIASHRQCRLGERINLPDGTPVNATIHLMDELGHILDSISEALKVVEKKIEHFLKIDDLVKQKNIPVEKVSQVKIEVDIDHDKAKQKNNQLVLDVIPTVLKSDLLKPSEALNKLAVKKRKFYRKGDKGDEVELIQKALIQLGFDLGAAGADGDFGSGTKSKVELFQNSYKPKNDVHPDYQLGAADGIVGQNSIKALDEALVDGWKYEVKLWKIIFNKPTTLTGTYNQSVEIVNSDGNVILKVRGSSKPNPFKPKNSSIKGEDAYPYVQSGTYSVDHGLHKGKPALVLNSNGYVPTININPNHPSYGKNANYIHIHWGYSKTWRGSAGCMTIHPDDWASFLSSVPVGKGEVIIK